MTTDQIIRQWFDALPADAKTSEADLANSMPHLRALVCAAVEAEREACAKVADELECLNMTDDDEAKYVKRLCRGHDIPMCFHADRIAAAIRNRKEQL